MANRTFNDVNALQKAVILLEGNCVIDSGQPVSSLELGDAKKFAVLAASTVTDAGSSVLSGDLGLWPGTSITGFPPATYSGTLHQTDAAAAAAQLAITAAYINLALRPTTQDLSGQNLGGKTLTPGVYKFSTSAQLTGTLTLDGQGDPNAMFVFQIGSTLTTATSAVVALINSANAGNVFWQVGSSATIGVSTTFVGSIIALASVTVNTSASIQGHAFARTGAVTLDGNVITAPAAATGNQTRSVKGSGIKAIKHVATGTYKVQLDDQYCRYLGGFSGFVSPVTGNTAIGSLSVGQVYVIRTMGTSTQADWHLAGVPVGVVAAPGVAFVAASATGTGNGSVFSTAASQIVCVQVVGDPNLTINNDSDPHMFIQTMAPMSSSISTMVPTDPSNGSVLGLGFMLRNSSVPGRGE